jgi:S1-C subfamily serine protease
MIAVRHSFLALLAVATALPATGLAQRRELRDTTARRKVSVFRGDSVWTNLFTQRRARLGVTVDLQSTDSTGALIEAVTPGGPAAKAGIKSGDFITRIDGKSLAGAEAGSRLVEIASQLKPEQTVSLEYQRGGTRHTASLVTGDEPIMVFDGPEGQMRFNVPDVQWERLPRGFAFGTGPGNFTFEMGGGLMDLQLAPLNPELGQYFGTSEGVLVINVPKESALGLKPGDVVLTVDGRKVSGVSSLFRILRSYEPEDSFKMDIMRNKSRTTVTGKMDRPHREQ